MIPVNEGMPIGGMLGSTKAIVTNFGFLETKVRESNEWHRFSIGGNSRPEEYYKIWHDESLGYGRFSAEHSLFDKRYSASRLCDLVEELD